MRDFLGFLVFYCSVVFSTLGTFLITTIIPLALVGYEIIIANSARRYAPRWLSIISYPTRARGIIVN